ncbi:IclR family transcriptional regulator [Actinomadura rubrisoli]|uniref:IclR family transcriptional regulator n=1 Tax=Actinomadura rubrisoli TaxID=2530368 RepID=A0A4R5C9D5_9ACTN|nr:IclR family transcriptional regulator [Actinomadura rubrisoli]TDD96428.1 IclR family transcriptional regulator [Actinomadura rubrisoli]
MTRPTKASRPPSVDDARPAAANYHAHALARGLALLEELARAREPVTLNDLADTTGLPKSTLVRLLAVLAETEYVVRVDDRPAYRLGHKVLGLSTAYLSVLDVASAARGSLTELAEISGQTANLGVLDGRQVLHVCVEEPDRPVRYTAVSGSRADTYCTGLGKLLLAGLDEQEVAAHVPDEPYAARTARTITDLHGLLQDLRKVRRQGYAFDNDEYSVGLRCIAVPLEIDGQWLASISISGPSGEFSADRRTGYLGHLNATAAAMTADPDLVAGLRFLSHSLVAGRGRIE